MDQFRRQADRQLARECQRGQVEIRRRPIARCATEEDSQCVLRHAELLLEPGLQCLIRGKLTFSSDHITVRHCSGLPLSAHELQILPIEIKNIADGL